jgi:heme exporter protein D
MEHILGWGDVSFFFVCWYAVAIILLIIALRVCLSTVTKNYLFKTQSQKKRKKKIPLFLIIRITTQQLAQLKLAGSFRQ